MAKVKFSTISGNEFVKEFATKVELMEYISLFEKALPKGQAILVTADYFGGFRSWIHGEGDK